MKVRKIAYVGAFLLLLVTACSNTPANVVSSNQAKPEGVPAWTTIPFADARTGKNMTFADYAGKTLVVEAMAVWCEECFYQQTQAAQAIKRLNKDAVVYISLDIDPSADTKLLADYVTKHNFTWTFGSSNKALMDGLVAQFGRAVTSPSNMPIFLISPRGKVSKLYTGGHSADQLVTLIEEWSKA
jgi:cytochrome oxidase Cu insertion factor (SCO1/SenC/PrrC family)